MKSRKEQELGNIWKWSEMREKEKKGIWMRMIENKPVKVNWGKNLIWGKYGHKHRGGTWTKLSEILNREALPCVVVLDWVPVFKPGVQIELYWPEKKGKRIQAFLELRYFFFFICFDLLLYFYCLHYYRCPHPPPPFAHPCPPSPLAITTLLSVSMGHAYMFFGCSLHLLSSSSSPTPLSFVSWLKP